MKRGLELVARQLGRFPKRFLCGPLVHTSCGKKLVPVGVEREEDLKNVWREALGLIIKLQRELVQKQRNLYLISEKCCDKIDVILEQPVFDLVLRRPGTISVHRTAAGLADHVRNEIIRKAFCKTA